MSEKRDRVSNTKYRGGERGRDDGGCGKERGITHKEAGGKGGDYTVVWCLNNTVYLINHKHAPEPKTLSQKASGIPLDTLRHR